MAKKTIALLYGGKSGEHEVSKRSAASVYSRLNRKKYEIILIGIDTDGIWYLQDQKAAEASSTGSLELSTNSANLVYMIPGKGLYSRQERLPVDIVFPVLHGSFGEDGTMQGLLEIAELAYVGAGVLGSAVSMDKEKTKQLWQQAGLQVVPSVTLHRFEYSSFDFTSRTRREEIVGKLGLPLFVKPASTGSSVGVTKVSSADQLDQAIEAAFAFDMKVLVEKGIDAREIECSVTGNGSAVRAYTPGEIIASHEFYDYDAKYQDADGAVLTIPAKLLSETIRKIQETAVTAYRTVECEGMARVDFFIDKRTEELFLNEINTIPGFTNISMFSKMCEASGLPYGKLLDHLIDLGFERRSGRTKLRFSR